MARTQMFSPKDPKTRIQGILTTKGGRAFEAARERLSKLFQSVIGRTPTVVSDADTVEFLARGEENCRRALAETQAEAERNGK